MLGARNTTFLNNSIKQLMLDCRAKNNRIYTFYKWQLFTKNRKSMFQWQMGQNSYFIYRKGLRYLNINTAGSIHCEKYRNFTYFLVWKFCEIFHTRKSGEITVFFAVIPLTISLYICKTQNSKLGNILIWPECWRVSLEITEYYSDMLWHMILT